MSKKNAAASAYSYCAVISRIMAAAFGGYAMTSGATVLLAILLPTSRSEAILVATLLSFTIYTVAVLWVFSANNASRAWAGMIFSTALFSGTAWILIYTGNTA